MKRHFILGFAVLVIALLAPPRTKADGIFTATLLGSNEVPADASPATGSITVTLTGDSLAVSESFSGLEAPATAAHIHCCAASGTNAAVAVPFTSFPNTTSGTYSNTFDLTLTSVYTSAFLTASGGTAAGAESALVTALFAGDAYANIHDAIFPGGEIRGQLAQTPEPSSLMLLGMGLVGLALRRKRPA